MIPLSKLQILASLSSSSQVHNPNTRLPAPLAVYGPTLMQLTSYLLLLVLLLLLINGADFLVETTLYTTLILVFLLECKKLTTLLFYLSAIKSQQITINP